MGVGNLRLSGLQMTTVLAVADTGAIGGRSLDFLRLASVLKPAGKLRDVLTGHWFGMWS